jgi:hypothetical protein
MISWVTAFFLGVMVDDRQRCHRFDGTTFPLKLDAWNWACHQHDIDTIADQVELSYISSWNPNTVEYLKRITRAEQVIENYKDEASAARKNSNVYVCPGGADIVAPRKYYLLYTPKSRKDVSIQTM